MHPTHSPNQLPRTLAVASRDPPAVGSRSAVSGPPPSLYFTLYCTLLGMAESYPSRVRSPPPPSVRVWYPHCPELVPRPMAGHDGWWGWPLLSPTPWEQGVVLIKSRVGSGLVALSVCHTLTRPKPRTPAPVVERRVGQSLSKPAAAGPRSRARLGGTVPMPGSGSSPLPSPQLTVTHRP